MNFLQVQHISKQFGATTVVVPIRFVLNNNRNLAIAGETGSGKSTLLKMIGGLVQPDSGEIYFEGEKVLGPLAYTTNTFKVI